MDTSKYLNQLPYPKIPSKPRLKPDHTLSDLEAYTKDYQEYIMRKDKYEADRKLYRNHDRELLLKFKQDALEELGIADHPKASMAFEMAWDHGHSYGYSEVFTILTELSSLLA